MDAKKVCILLVCVLFFVSGVIANTQAESVVFDNDGTARENPYGKCDVPPSFEGEYYDCYIPYELTCEEIGGIALPGGRYPAMSESDKKNKISGKFNYEMDISGSYGQNFTQYLGEYTYDYCEDTDAVTVNGSDGYSFYMAALPSFCYKNTLVGTNGFPGWGLDNRGQVYDLIFTDGTVLHFIVGDAKADQHTNGGGERGRDYVTNTINYDQYKFLFQAQAGETVEIFGRTANCVVSFMRHYNIGNGEDKNRVAYIRMYNIRLRDGNVQRLSGVPEGVGYNLGEVTIDANSSGDSIFVIPEYQLSGMPTASNISEGAVNVLFPDRDGLSVQELISLQSSKDAIENRNAVKVYDFSRHLMVFIGLLLMSYVVLIVLAFSFDKVNNFVDISLVSICTFGSVKISNEKETRGVVGYSSNTKLYFSISVLSVLSVLLISGAVIPGVMRAVQWAINWVGGIF